MATQHYQAFYQEDGYRIQTDQIAGGAYYQSKATAADGIVYIGSPSRFVYALDTESGKERWKYELGAAISGAPVFYNGRIYVGQQGGEDEFYCLDAKTGKMIWTQNVGWVWVPLLFPTVWYSFRELMGIYMHLTPRMGYRLALQDGIFYL